MNFRRFCLAIFLAVGVFLLARQRAEAASATLDWVNTVGTANSDKVMSVATDSAGNIYVTGFVETTTDLNPGAGTDEITPTGAIAGYVSKFQSDGTYLWSKVINTSATNLAYVNDVAVDVANDRMYLVGSFAGMVDLDPGAGTQNETAVIQDGYFLILDLDGEYIDHKVYSAENNDYITDVEIDADDNILLMGNYFADASTGSTMNFNPDGNDIHTNAAGSNQIDSFILKYNSSLVYQWGRALEGTGTLRAWDLHVGSDGAVYMAGVISDGVDIDFDGTAGTDEKDAPGEDDAFVLKYSSSGAYAWSHVIGTVDYEYAYDVATDSNQNVYIAGELYYENIDLDPTSGVDLHNSDADGNGGAFLSKYSEDGSYGWSRSWDGSDWDTAYALSVNSSDRIIVATFTGSPTIDIDGTAGTTELTIDGSAYITALSMYNANGDFGFGYLIGVGASNQEPVKLHSNGSSLYALGDFAGTGVDFDPSGSSTSIDSAGSSDVFLAAYTIDSTMVGGAGESESSPSTSGSSPPGSSSGGSDKAATCSAEDPTSAPDLFQIDSENGVAKLYFSPASGQVSGYHVLYGFIPGLYFFGTTFDKVNNNEGVQSVTIHELVPYLRYNFKVMAVNGCAPGPWSQDLGVKVLKNGKQSSFFYR